MITCIVNNDIIEIYTDGDCFLCVTGCGDKQVNKLSWKCSKKEMKDLSNKIRSILSHYNK